ncbi:hypothetical protein M3Y99_01861600 [Aphelenchoides fujianensis]|nr:hypothetical protein M3Y99_01861600 [Aphelenchoides fujianensis]
MRAAWLSSFASSALLAVVVVVTAQNNRRPNCPRYWEPFQNSHNQWRCVPNQGSCRGSSDWTGHNCNNACRNFRQHCRSADHCVTHPCDSCQPLYFDDDWDQVCRH